MSLKFDCPHCHARLSAEPEHYGKKVDCPECSMALMVPRPQDIGAALQDHHDTVKFLCPHCNRRLSAVSHQFGKEMPCPHADCQKPVLIPRPEWKPIPTTLLKQGSPDTDDLIKKAQEMTGKTSKQNTA